MVPMPLLDMRWTSKSINNQYKLVGNKLHVQINDTRVVAWHKIRYYNTKACKSYKRHEVCIDQIYKQYRIID